MSRAEPFARHTLRRVCLCWLHYVRHDTSRHKGGDVLCAKLCTRPNVGLESNLWYGLFGGFSRFVRFTSLAATDIDRSPASGGPIHGPGYLPS